MTEHEDLAAANPDIVARLTSRSAELAKTIWDSKWTGYTSSCIDPAAARNEMYGGFIGPFCDIGPAPPTPPPPPAPPVPGPFNPTNLSNCSYLLNTWTWPAHQNDDKAATTRAECCSACGMDPACLAAVLTCPKDGGGACYCNLKPWNAGAKLMHSQNPSHTTLTCLTGRQNITG